MSLELLGTCYRLYDNCNIEMNTYEYHENTPLPLVIISVYLGYSREYYTINNIEYIMIKTGEKKQQLRNEG